MEGEDIPTKELSAADAEGAWSYARAYYPDDSFIHDLERIGRYQPGVPIGYLKLRQASFTTGADAALTPKVKELLMVAMALGARKTSPPPFGHVRLAIDAGATIQEIAELVGLSMFYCGGLTFHETGRHVLRFAEEYAAQKIAAQE